MTFLIALDLVLILGFTLRLSRLVIFDGLGEWYVQQPIRNWASKRPPTSWRHKVLFGLECPFCVGFWLGALVLSTFVLTGSLGAENDPKTLWRFVAGLFTLNYLAAHIGARLGDAGYADDDD